MLRIRTRMILRRSALATALLGAAVAGAQVWENPEDPTGILIPHRLVHLVHSRDAGQPGTTAALRSHDPYLFYQTGRDLLHRQYTLEHGVYGQAGQLTVPLYVASPGQNMVHGAPARFARDHSSSCGMCHSSLFREPSAGQTIASTGGMGRNTTSFYGAGLIEMLGAQIRHQVLARYDRDRDGLIDRDEVAGPAPVALRPAPGAEPVDYGDLAPGPDGVPRLNPLFRVWYVDAQGKVLKDALSLKDPRAVAYGFAVQPFGWGRGHRLVGGVWISEGGESATAREFFTVAADFHMGLQAYDPSQIGADPDTAGFGGLAKVTLNGAQQFGFGGSPDLGLTRSPEGLSLDDPDRDGHLNELTEGDVDAIEFYLLHTPAPAVRATATSEQGRAVLQRVGCTRCHVESWRVEARDEAAGWPGDRRLFRLETSSRIGADGVSEVVGALVPSARTLPSGERVPAGEAYAVERIYTDFKQWDVGPGFHERRFDGSLQKEHRTAPLWGIAGTAPYGHDGRHLTLEDAILAHAGAAEAEAAAYRALAATERRQLVDYLKSLVLYPTDEIPADVDGDGKAAEAFTVAGQAVGYERFDARFLFRLPPRYKHMGDTVRYHGRSVPLMLIENIAETYGLDLAHRVDANQDGFPDVLRPVQKEEGASHEPSSAR